MKDSYEYRSFLKLCKAIVNTCPDYYDEDIFIHWLSKYNKKNHTHFKWTCGCTRFVVLGDTIVLKWNVTKDEEMDWGDCETELKIYEQAVKDGFAYLFAHCEHIRVIYQDFYFYPRIHNIGGRAHCHYEIDHFCSLNEYYYITTRIGDLHDDNWGVQNGHPVIVDYAYLIK